MLEGVHRVHLIGIGGIGVSAVARVLLARGFQVSGSDVRESQLTQGLRDEGADVTIGHRADLVDGADLVVYSTAVPATNPELIAARERGVPVRHRAEVLGALLPAWRSVGVVGTHGKGTVSAMITRCFESAGRDPSFIIGGLLLDYGTNARVTAPAEGKGHAVVEIDESDGSLVHVRPDRLVINNVEADHLNYYKDRDAVIDTIAGVLADERDRQLVIAHVGDEGVRDVLSRLTRPIRVLRVAFEDDLPPGHEAEVSARDLTLSAAGSEFTLVYHGREVCRLSMPRPGRYNAMNALVAAATALSYDLPIDSIRDGLAAFAGIENRFTVVQRGAARIVKDYTSHPTGMRRVIAAAKTLSDAPITAVFKPYRFTMIHYLGDEYAVAFREAARVVVTELYTAGEVPIAGVDAQWLVDKIRATGTPVDFVPEMNDLPLHLPEARDGATVLFFGGDDLFRLADAFAATLPA